VGLSGDSGELVPPDLIGEPMGDDCALRDWLESRPVLICMMPLEFTGFIREKECVDMSDGLEFALIARLSIALTQGSSLWIALPALA